MPHLVINFALPHQRIHDLQRRKAAVRILAAWDQSKEETGQAFTVPTGVCFLSVFFAAMAKWHDQAPAQLPASIRSC
jgi:hypothetical protein